MKKSEIMNIINEMNLEINQNNEYLMNIQTKRDFESKIQKELKIDSKDSKKFILSFKDSDDKKNYQIKFRLFQYHKSIDRDIKIKSEKFNQFINLKLIYHRKKDNSKEFRIYYSFYDNNKKLKRFRLINENIQKIHDNEEKMIEYFDNLIKEKRISELSKYNIG